MDRIVSQLLAELSDIHRCTDIFVIGATNRLFFFVICVCGFFLFCFIVVVIYLFCFVLFCFVVGFCIAVGTFLLCNTIFLQQIYLFLLLLQT